MTDEGQFKNCFDQAILHMIDRGMDVKELVNSPLFFVPVWSQLSLFSSEEKTEFLSYNEDIDELEFEDPHKIFENPEEKEGFDQEAYENDQQVTMTPGTASPMFK